MSTVRRGQRPGGAALQLDVLAFSTALDNSEIVDGRLKASLESMMQCAVRPEMEMNAAKPPSTADTRMQYASRIRLALAMGKTADEFLKNEPSKTGAGLTTTTGATVGTSSTASSISSSTTGGTTVPSNDTKSSSSVNPEIPFILDSSRCEMGSTGFRLLSSLLMNKACQRLTFLDLSSNSATDLGKEFIGVQAICESLSTLPRLTYLSLHNNILLAPGCEAISKFLSKTPSLQYLDLSRCNIGPGGSKELCRAFYSRTLHSKPKDMDGNDETTNHGVYLPDEEEDEVAHDGDDSSTVGTASSSSSWSGNDSNRVLNQTLVWLDLSENNLSGYGSREKVNTKAIKHLLSGLLHHPHIRSLDLSRNRLTRQDVLTIADTIETNTKLQILTLDENSIDAFPAARIAASLISNTTLTTLSLRANRIRSDGASAFADLLRRQTTLQSLDIRNNYIGDIGQKDMQLALLNLPPPPEVSAYGNTGSNDLGTTTMTNEGKENNDGDDNIHNNYDNDDDAMNNNYSTTGSNDSRPATASTSDVMDESLSNWEERTVTTNDGLDDVSSLVSGRKSANQNPISPVIDDNSRPPTATDSVHSNVHSSSSSSSSLSMRPAPEPGSLEYYAEMKQGDDDDDDDDVSRTKNPSTMVSSSSSSSSSSTSMVPNQSPSRAVGSGIRAVMALRQPQDSTTTNESKTETNRGTDNTVSPPQIIETEDGAWLDSKGRKVYIITDTVEQ